MNSNIALTSKKKQSIWKRILNVLFYVLLGILFVLACISMTFRLTKGKIGNSQYLVVISGSMDGERQDYEIESVPIKSFIKVDLIEEGKE